MTIRRPLSALLLLLAALLPATAEPARPADGWQEHDAGFWLRVPEGWRKRPAKREMVFQAVAPGATAFLEVYHLAGAGRISAEQLADGWEEAAGDDTAYLKTRVADRELSIGEATAVRREYRATRDGVPLRATLLYISRGDRQYVVVGVAGGTDNARRRAVREAVDSFRLSPPAPAGASAAAWHLDREHGFRLPRAAAWRAKEGELVKDQALQWQSPRGLAMLEVYLGPLPAGRMSLQDFADAVETSFSEKVPYMNRRRAARRLTLADGTAAIRREYEGTVEGQTVSATLLYTLGAQRYYLVVGICAASADEAVRADLARMLGGFAPTATRPDRAARTPDAAPARPAAGDDAGALLGRTAVTPEQAARLAVAGVTVEVPAGGVTETAELTVREAGPRLRAGLDPAEPVAAGPYLIELDQPLRKPARLAFAYEGPAERNGLVPTLAAVVGPDRLRGGWQHLPLITVPTRYDRGEGLLEATVPHFSAWVVTFAPEEFVEVETDHFHVVRPVRPGEEGQRPAMLRELHAVARDCEEAYALLREELGFTPEQMPLGAGAEAWLKQKLGRYLGTVRTTMRVEIDPELDVADGHYGLFVASWALRGQGTMKIASVLGVPAKDRPAARQARRATVYHEFLHYVQDWSMPGLTALNLKEAGSPYLWFDEATAVCLERFIAPRAKPAVTAGNERFFIHPLPRMEALFGASRREAANYGYGASALVHFIAEEHVGRDLIGRTYARIAGQSTGRRSALRALRQTLAAERKTLSDFWHPYLAHQVRTALQGSPQARLVDLSESLSAYRLSGSRPLRARFDLGPFTARVVTARYGGLPADRLRVTLQPGVPGTEVQLYEASPKRALVQRLGKVYHHELRAGGEAAATHQSLSLDVQLRHPERGYLVLAIGRDGAHPEPAAAATTVTVQPLGATSTQTLIKPSSVFPSKAEMPGQEEVPALAAYGEWQIHDQQNNDRRVQNPDIGVTLATATRRYTAVERESDGPPKRLDLYLIVYAVDDAERQKQHWETLRQRGETGGWRDPFPRRGAPTALGEEGRISAEKGWTQIWFRRGNVWVKVRGRHGDLVNRLATLASAKLP
jgi:hypothetical protein